MKKSAQAIIFALFVSLLMNAVDWAFNGEVFAHELDRAHHVISLDPAAHIEEHRRAINNDDGHSDAATHLCLHAAGQYQPLFFSSPLFVPHSTGREVFSAFISINLPEFRANSPLRPPRNISAS
jgi:hypothetical protein